MRYIDMGKPLHFSKQETFQLSFHRQHAQGQVYTSPPFSYQSLQFTLTSIYHADCVLATLELDASSMQQEEHYVRYAIHLPNPAPMPALETKRFTNIDLETGWRQVQFSALPADATLTLIARLEVDVSMHENAWTPTPALQFGMLDMLNDEQFADIEFHVGKGDHHRTLQAHSQILMARSSPSMQEIIRLAQQDQSANKTSKIDQGDTDSTTIMIQLPDVDPNHFQSILRYIYAEDISVLETGTDFKRLLATANQFGCWKLKLHIEAKLIRGSLDFGSSIDLLSFADAQDCFMLKEAAIDEIVRNFADLISHPDFHKLAGSSELLQEMQRHAKHFDSCDDDVNDQYSDMKIGKLYQEFEKNGKKIESDGSRAMLLKQLRSSNQDAM